MALNPLPLKKTPVTTPVTPDPNYINGVLKTDSNFDQYGVPVGQTGSVYGAGGVKLGTTFGGSGVLNPEAPQPQPDQGSGLVNSGVGGDSNSDNTSTPFQAKPVSLYEQMLQKRLAGQDPNVLNAQKQQNTDTAMGRYSAMKQAGTQSQQAGFTPGTLQSQRVTDRATAGAAEQALSGQDRVNAMARASGESALQDQNALETQTYNRGEGLVSSIQDPKARQAAQSLINGGMSPQEAYNKVIGTSGTVNTDYQSSSPEATKLQGFVEQAQTEGLSPEQAQAEGLKRYKAANQTAGAPTDQAGTDRAAANILSSVNRGEPVDWNTPEAKAVLGQAPTLEAATAQSGNISTFGSAYTGKLVTLGGKPYQVTGTQSVDNGQGNGRHIDVILATDATTGKKVLINNSTKQVTQLG